MRLYEQSLGPRIKKSGKKIEFRKNIILIRLLVIGGNSARKMKKQGFIRKNRGYCT
jgi:hypothetical protein